jgi:hypothetical protein
MFSINPQFPKLLSWVAIFIPPLTYHLVGQNYILLSTHPVANTKQIYIWTCLELLANLSAYMACNKVSQARRLVILYRSVTSGPAKTSGWNTPFSERLQNFNVVYIRTYVWQRWKPSLSIFCTMFQHYQCRKLSCGTVVCKHLASYQGYPNYRWDLIR